MATETTAPTLDTVMAAIGWKTNLAGGLTAVLGWLLSAQGAALVGIVGVLGGLAIQWYFKRRQDQREDRQDQRDQEEHEARMRAQQ